MEQEQNSYSESSSDHKNQANEEMIVARSYDCTFCKRGFTNAQALGGHMNIHRKDKAKAKKENHKNLQDLSFYSKSSIFPQITTPYYGDQSFGGHVNYGVYVPSPSPSGLQTGNHEYCFFPIWRPNNLEDRRDGNLSLRMGTVEDEDEEVDLELRLGRLL